MATTRIKEKISTLVNSQLPEFIRSDYTTFVAFIEYYYKFLEQDQGALEIVQNARSYNDIDNTTDAFVSYFLANYAQDIPVSVLANKGLLVKRIRDLYESKGSEISFKLLFQLLYNEPVEITYPYENVLIASGGEWEQKSTIRVTLTSGSIEDVDDRYLDLTQNNLLYRTSIISTKFLSANLYEFILEHNELAPYIIGDVVTVSSKTGIIFTGVVAGTTDSVSVQTAGSGFRVGQIFYINVSGGTGTQLQVSAVDSSGGITKIRIINYGYNYRRSMSIALQNGDKFARYAQDKQSKTLGFAERISIFGTYGPSDSGRYFDADYNDDTPIDYTANTIALVSTSTTAPGGNNETDPQDNTLAAISLTVGAISRYPGSYISNKGFLSDDIIRLQDEKQYQPFAYRAESTLEFSTFQDIITKLIHPAGQRLFNNRVLTNTINAVANVSVITSTNIFLELRDVIFISDVSQTGLLITFPLDFPIIQDTITISLQGQFTEDISVVDLFSITLTKNIADEAVILDDTPLFNVAKLVSDNIDTTDTVSTSLLIAYSLTDNVNISDILTSNVATQYTDDISIFETISVSIQKSLRDEVIVTESDTISEASTFSDSFSMLDAISFNLSKALNEDTSATEVPSGIIVNYTV